MDLKTLSDANLIELYEMFARQHSIECNRWWNIAVVDINDPRLEKIDRDCKQMCQVCTELYDEKAQRHIA